MMTQTDELIRALNLQSEVDAFVRERAATLLTAGERHDVDFVGSGNPGCRSGKPHPPHWTGEGYQTVRAGYVRRFCRGQEGTLPNGGELHIVWHSSHGGSPTSLSDARGYWFIEYPPVV